MEICTVERTWNIKYFNYADNACVFILYNVTSIGNRMDSAVKMEGSDSENECTQRGLRSNIDKALQMLIQETGISRERLLSAPCN